MLGLTSLCGRKTQGPAPPPAVAAWGYLVPFVLQVLGRLLCLAFPGYSPVHTAWLGGTAGSRNGAMGTQLHPPLWQGTVMSGHCL